MYNSLKLNIQDLSHAMDGLDETIELASSLNEQILLAIKSWPLPLWIKNLDQKVVFVNRAFEADYGITLDGLQAEDLWTDEQLAWAERTHLEVINTRQSMIYQIERQPGVQLLIMKWPIYYKKEITGVASTIISKHYETIEPVDKLLDK